MWEYIILIVIIVFAISSVLYMQHTSHIRELNRIKMLESKYQRKEEMLQKLRMQTSECPVPNLRDPRSCYFGSNYTCKWNERIGRCDMI